MIHRHDNTTPIGKKISSDDRPTKYNNKFLSVVVNPPSITTLLLRSQSPHAQAAAPPTTTPPWLIPEDSAAFRY